MELKTKIKKKLHSRAGFSLTELLLAVLILLMVSSIVVAGIPAAREAYEKVVLSSNADVLMSTTISMLRNELGTAGDIEVKESAITYYNSTRGAYSKIYKAGERADIMLIRYFNKAALDTQASDPEYLISKETATNNLHVTYGSVTYTPATGIICFSNLAVRHDSKTLASRESLSIRVITEK
jgi:prepilin-type N-terminal cleavage/methylation domain-containing protein